MDIKPAIAENIKAIFSIVVVTSNSMIQWLSNADTVMKVIATAMTVPAGYFFARFMYFQVELKRLEIENQKRLNSEPKE
jgi:hypothetical protein